MPHGVTHITRTGLAGDWGVRYARANKPGAKGLWRNPKEGRMAAKYPTFEEALQAEILAPLGSAASDYDIEALAEALLIDGTHDGVTFWEPRIDLSNGVLLEIAEDYLL